MKSKTLNTIQKLVKIGRILSKIIEICCIIGAVGCLIGIVSISVCGIDTFKIGGITIHSMIEKSAEMSIGTMYAEMIAGLILCIGESIIAKLAEKYFKNELVSGTPFSFEGAKELLRLGISVISISIGALIMTDISYAVVNHCFSDVADMHLDDFNQVGIGIAFIIISLLCKYGAERDSEMETEKISNEK